MNNAHCRTSVVRLVPGLNLFALDLLHKTYCAQFYAALSDGKYCQRLTAIRSQMASSCRSCITFLIDSSRMHLEGRILVCYRCIARVTILSVCNLLVISRHSNLIKEHLAFSYLTSST
jgi:hypothetical protein